MTHGVMALVFFVFIVIALVTEKIPTTVVALSVPLFMVFTGIMTAEEAVSRFAYRTIVLSACIYILSHAFFKVGLADRIGTVVRRISMRHKDGERFIYIVIMLVVTLMTTCLPRYGVIASLMPVVIATAMSTGISRSKLLMVLMLSTNFAGGNTLIATPPFLIASGYLESAGFEGYAFFDFAYTGIPMTLFGMAYILFFSDKMLPTRYKESPVADGEEYRPPENDTPKWQVWITAILFFIYALGMMFEEQLNIPGQIVAMGCVLLLIATGVLGDGEAFRAVKWPAVIFNFGMLTLGDGLSASGAGEMIGEFSVKVLGNTPSPYLITAVLFICGASMTQFMSNSGACAVLMPVGINIAVKIGADPRSIVMALTLACTASYMSPAAAPGNLIVMEPGDLRFKDYVKAGTPVMVFAFFVAMVILPIFWPYY